MTAARARRPLRGARTEDAALDGDGRALERTWGVERSAVWRRRGRRVVLARLVGRRGFRDTALLLDFAAVRTRLVRREALRLAMTLPFRTLTVRR